ncbi:MAG: hypothetical protein IPJ40_03435 [Saprospirales bacterium]|nr:hypothetical protein [Saprospirales bacterium]
MKFYTALFIPIIAISCLKGQDSTFNKRLSLGFNNLIFISIEVTDSCFFISGVAADSFPGSFFSRFDFQGNPLFYKLNKGENHSIMTRGKDLQPFGDGQWIVSGEGADSTGGYVICVVLASEGDTIKIIRSYNPYYPLDQFIATPAGLTQLGGNIFWQMNIGNHQTASFSNDLFLVKLNQDLEVNWTKKYISPKDESSWSLVPKGSTLLIGAWKTNFNTNNKKFTTQLYLLQIDTLNGNIIKTFHYPPTPTIYQLVGPADDMLVEEDGSIIVATRIGKEIVFGNFGEIFWDPQISKLILS